MPKHSYVSAKRFILSREFFGMKLGLQNISEFLALIGSPQNSYRTIHIAGTNGKGSAAAMLASILRAQGYKTGLFTSPHLVSFRERISVNGRKIPKPSVVAFVDRYRKELTKRKLSFFEVITAMGLCYFKNVHVDVAVVETGLGGRLDASNVLSPELTITTDISRDHVEILGSGLTQIAREKAGIIKKDTPHIIGILPPAAEKVISARCKKTGAPLYKLRYKDFEPHPELNQFDFRSNGWSFRQLKPMLYGTHQLRNAALVVKSTSVLQRHGLRIGKRAVRRGLQQTFWPGRFQVVEKNNKPVLVFDVCHNTGGVAAFVESFKVRFPDRRAQIISGFVKRKEHQKMFDLLGTIADQFHIVPLASHRSANVNDMLQTINWRGIPVQPYRSLQSAYRKVLKSSECDDIIAIIGSHFLVGEFFSKLGPV